jgi:hypothetical protein
MSHPRAAHRPACAAHARPGLRPTSARVERRRPSNESDGRVRVLLEQNRQLPASLPKTLNIYPCGALCLCLLRRRRGGFTSRPRAQPRRLAGDGPARLFLSRWEAAARSPARSRWPRTSPSPCSSFSFSASPTIKIRRHTAERWKERRPHGPLVGA